MNDVLVEIPTPGPRVVSAVSVGWAVAVLRQRGVIDSGRGRLSAALASLSDRDLLTRSQKLFDLIRDEDLIAYSPADLERISS
jgi:hypothetical protein